MIENLFNNFAVSGSNEEKLMTELKSISDITKLKTIKPYNLYVYSLKTKVKNGWKVIEFQPDEMDFDYLCSGNFPQEHTKQMLYEDFYKLGLTDDLISEIAENNYYLKYYDENDSTEHLIVPSPTLRNSILAVCKSGKLKRSDSPLDELIFAYTIQDSPDFSMIIREVNNVAKGYAAFSEKHGIERQDVIFRDKALGVIRKLHKETYVNYYSLDNKRTMIELSMPDLKQCIKTSNRKFLITPAFVYNYSDIGDYAATITPALIINGRAVVIGDMVRVLEEGFEEAIADYLIMFNQIVDKIYNTDNIEEVDKKESVMRILKKLGFYKSSKIGKTYVDAYNNYIDTFTEKCSKMEVLIEILNVPSVLYMYFLKKKNKILPQYLMDQLSTVSGNVFTIDFDRECF